MSSPRGRTLVCVRQFALLYHLSDHPPPLHFSRLHSGNGARGTARSCRAAGGSAGEAGVRLLDRLHAIVLPAANPVGASARSVCAPTQGPVHSAGVPDAREAASSKSSNGEVLAVCEAMFRAEEEESA